MLESRTAFQAIDGTKSSDIEESTAKVSTFLFAFFFVVFLDVFFVVCTSPTVVPFTAADFPSFDCYKSSTIHSIGQAVPSPLLNVRFVTVIIIITLITRVVTSFAAIISTSARLLLRAT